MSFKVLLDQGIPYSTTHLLRESGWNVDHTVDLKMSCATDREIIDYAIKEGCVCVTLDSDFHTILAVNDMGAPSVVRIRREGLRAKDMAKLLLDVWNQVEEHLASGALVTVTEEAIRLRKLPVGANVNLNKQ